MPKRDWICHLAAASFSLLIVTPPTLMLLDRRDPAVLQHGSITPNPARAGDYVTLMWNIKEYRACDGEFTPIIIDSGKKVHFFARQPTIYRYNLSPDGSKFYKVLQLPAALPPGNTVYVVRVQRWCNALQKYFWPIESKTGSIEFEVKE